MLVKDAKLSRVPAIDEHGLDANAILTMAAVIPDQRLRGVAGEIVLRVGSTSAGAEAVYLTLAQVTVD